MKTNLRFIVGAIVLSITLHAPVAVAQVVKGSIQGRVTDSTGAVLQGASVIVTPGGARAATTTEGDFAIPGLMPGTYTLTVDFVGFKEFTQSVTVTAGETMRVNVKLDVAGQTEEILVAAERARGEAEQVNRERTADNIIQVLSAEVTRRSHRWWHGRSGWRQLSLLAPAVRCAGERPHCSGAVRRRLWSESDERGVRLL